MKKILSFILTLSMLLSLFTVFCTATSAQEDASVPGSTKGTGSYLDLYVKDGLVALFTAYGAEASTSEVTEWEPVDLYGKTGYNSYVDPTTYEATLVKGNLYGWKWENGYLAHYAHTYSSNNRGEDAGSLMNLDALGAMLLTSTASTLTVQEVFQFGAPAKEAEKAIPNVNGNVVTNASALVSTDYMALGSGSVVGNANLRLYQYYGKLSSHMKAFGSYVFGGTMKSGYRNYYFGSEYWIGSNASLSGLTGNDGASYSGYLVGTTAWGIVESSIIRKSATDYTVHYHFAPSHENTWGAGKNLTPSVASGTATDLKLFDSLPANVFSVRIYNDVLTEAEINQNHLADLCGYYGADANAVLSLSADELAQLIEATKGMSISRDVNKGALYLEAKNNFEIEIRRFDPPPALDDEKRAMSEYDELYIGADGSKSANGGGLIGLYTAFKGETDSVNLDHGVWYNKVAVSDASFAGGKYSATQTSGWKLRENGGVGYDLNIVGTDGYPNYLKAQECINVLSFDPAMLSSPDFTVEYSAIYLNYYRNGEEFTGFESVVDAEPTERFGYFGNFTSRAGSLGTTSSTVDNSPEGIRQVRWFVGFPGETWSTVYEKRIRGAHEATQDHIAKKCYNEKNQCSFSPYASGQELWKDYSRMIPKVYMQTVTRDESADGQSAAYTAYSDVQKKAGATWQVAVGEGSFYYYPKSDPNYVFQLFYRVPVTVYSVRVYDAVLTEAEMNHNRFIDLAAFYGTDLSDYADLSTDIRTVIDTAMAEATFEMGADAFETLLDGIISQMVFTFDPDSTLYVTDGLTVLLAAYNKMNTGSFDAASNQYLWYNGMSEGTYATLKGTGWQANENGGFTIVKNINTSCSSPDPQYTSLYNYKEDYGVYLQSSMLPSGSYTVEYVANPVGVTDDDGNRAVLNMVSTSTDLYSENSIAIGPLRGMQFDGIKAGAALMTRRWYYGTGDSPHSDAWAGKPPFGKPAAGNRGNLPGYPVDEAWANLGLTDVITSSITLDVSTGEHVYTFYQDSEKLGTSLIPMNKIIPASEDPRFVLMGHVAGTVYSVRVYDRVLSEAERSQNHFADLVYYYGLDISAIEAAIETMTDLSPITSAFSDMGFDMTKDEAQAYFNSKMSKIWLSYSGFAVKNDRNDGMRFYFDINEAGILAMLSAGASIEIGALVNVGKNAYPVLEGYAYDYKLVAFDGVMGRDTSLFTDEDTFAVTVLYKNAQRENLMKDVLCQGYVKLSFEDGTSTTYYADVSELAPQNLFIGYNEMIEADGEQLNKDQGLINFINERIEACYTTSTIHLDAAAAEGGTGSAEAPFKYFEDAFAAMKQQMKSMTLPTHIVISAKDGKYSVGSAQEFTDADRAYTYSDLTIVSEGGGTVLTTAVDIAGSFTSEGGNIYSYQFEKDAEGNYPTFRYILVDGKMANIAYNGGNYPTKEVMMQLAFDRPFEGVWQTIVDEALAGRLTMSSPIVSQYAGREDLVALYEYYRPRAVAYGEIVALYNSLPKNGKNAATDGAALENAMPSYTNADYVNAFDLYKARYLGRYEAECDGRRDGIRSSAYKPNYTYVKTEAENPRLYTYQQTRHRTYWWAVQTYYTDDINAIPPYELPMDMKPGADGKSLKKMYLSENLLGAEVIALAAADATNFKTNLSGLGIQIDITAQYMRNINEVLGVDTGDYYVKDGEKYYATYLDKYDDMQFPAGGEGVFTLEGYFVVAMGHTSYLDKDNEFVYDQANGKLYYYSATGVEGKSFSRLTSDYLLKFDGIDNLTIDGLTITGVDDYFMSENGLNGTLGMGDYDNPGNQTYAGLFPDRSAIYMRDVSNAVIKNCTFSELGCEGITARGWMENIAVEGNSFTNIGAGTIRFGENIREMEMDTWQDGVLGNVNVVVQNNYLKDVSTKYSVAGIQITTAYKCLIDGNTVDDCAYVGISVGWQWAYSTTRPTLCRNVEDTTISNNFVSGFMNRTHDGGAIYVAGPNTMVDDERIFNTMVNNYVLYTTDTGDGSGGFDAGLYFDGASSAWLCKGNVIVAPAYGADESETRYDDWDTTPEEAARRKAARDGATYIYLQHITNQVVNHITLEDNMIINVRETKKDKQRTEVYSTYLQYAPGKKVTDNDSTIYYVGMDANELRDAARIIMTTGSSGHKGDMNQITDNNY